MLFIWGLGFLGNWIYNLSIGVPDDSYIFAIVFVIWGWDDRPTFLKEKWLKLKWGHICYRHIVILKSMEKVEEFYPPVYNWIMDNVGLNQVWLELEVDQLVSKHNPTLILGQGSAYYEFRFKKKKDAAHFRLVWG